MLCRKKSLGQGTRNFIRTSSRLLSESQSQENEYIRKRLSGDQIPRLSMRSSCMACYKVEYNIYYTGVFWDIAQVAKCRVVVGFL